MIEAPEPPHQHHHKTGLPWFDLIVPIAVLCISIASLLTALQSEKSMHALVEQNRRLVSAQSTPLLMLDTGNVEAGKPVLTITLSNVGTYCFRLDQRPITTLSPVENLTAATQSYRDLFNPRPIATAYVL